jgi:hypothetical protein
MKKSIFISVVLIMMGSFFLTNSYYKSEIASIDEVKNLSGSCTQENISGTQKVCNGSNCSSGGCGCKERSVWIDGVTGTRPSPPASCGTSACTSPLTLETGGTCAG